MSCGNGDGDGGGCEPEKGRARFKEHPLRWLEEHPLRCLEEEPTWLSKRKRRDKKKADTEAETKKRKAEVEAARAADQRRSGWLRFWSGRRIEFRAPDLWRGVEDSSAAEVDDDEKPDKLGSGILKAAGWVATGITATGLIVVVGAAVAWIRFNEVGIPATQAVSVQPQGEALALGAQETIIFVGIALVVVLLVFFVDPKGEIRRVTLGLLLALLVGAVWYVICRTHLTPDIKVGLCVFAFLLLLGSVAVGHRSGTRFWPLALAVFVAALVFSAAVGILVVRQQKFVQGVAILRGADDAGLTGVYIAATEKTIYFAQNVATGTDAKSRMAMMEVPREGATYAVGPLEPRADAAKREGLMLEQLIANRERGGVAPEKAPKEPAVDIGAKEEEEEAKAGKGEGGAEAGGSATAANGDEQKAGSREVETKTVAEAFGEGAVTVHETVEEPWNCLVRYASAGSRRLGKWWMSCKTAEELAGKTMLALRNIFALPSRFQFAYDMRVTARLPEGAKTYMTGPVAPQCEHAKPLPCGYTWPGGDVQQLYLPEPQQVGDIRRQCTETAIDHRPIWGECKDRG